MGKQPQASPKIQTTNFHTSLSAKWLYTTELQYELGSLGDHSEKHNLRLEYGRGPDLDCFDQKLVHHKGVLKLVLLPLPVFENKDLGDLLSAFESGDSMVLQGP